MMKEYFDNLVSGIEAKLAQNPEEKSPRKVYALEVAKIGCRLYSSDRAMAWCGIVAPFDLLSAMNVTSCFVEFIGAMLASTGMAATFAETAEHAGYAADICGYHRTVMGAALNGMMPEPDFLIATTCPCSGGVAVMENLARLFQKDLFVLNIPQEQTQTSVNYLAHQIRKMTDFISAHTGEPLDMERLSQSIEKTNQARNIMEEAFEFAAHVPSPVESRALANFGVVMALLLGTDAGVEVARTYRDAYEAIVKSPKHETSAEKLRLLWIQNRIQYKNPLLNMLEKNFSAKVVVDELNDITWDPIDPQHPFEGLALRAISIPFNGIASRRIAHLQKLARQYKIHGAINPCNWGCRQGTGARGIVADGLKEIGVPVLNLEVDCVDPRTFAEGQLKTRLEAFIEMLADRPSPWA
jgi:benzoyl-CoA reductase/2-hydroxyglutaryl-CoA dehydratase subunit BcrC/BadD/HgdB